MKTLSIYESASGQLINKNKGHFMVPSNAFPIIIRRINRMISFTLVSPKRTALYISWMPYIYWQQKIIYYYHLVDKVIARISCWQTNLLSYGGRVLLVKHVLQSLPIHLLSEVSSTKTILKQIQSLFVDFFWGWKEERKKYHWTSWKNLSFPCDECWIGIRQIANMATLFNISNGGCSKPKRLFEVTSCL